MTATQDHVQPHIQPQVGLARRSKRHRAVEAVIALSVFTLFCLKITNYADPNALRPSVVAQTVSVTTNNIVSAISNLPFLNDCPRALQMVDVVGGYVCTDRSVTGTYAQIYDTYPLVGKGRETIYSSTDEGSVAAADDLVKDVYDLPRYRPVALPGLPTWSENPYSAKYWRFEFYSLRPTLNLLYAFRTTHKAAYARRLVSLDLSFVAAERRSPWAWSDPHAVAFRAMSLVDTWWKLRQAHVLTEQASTAMLRELEKTGAFLADSNHYQIGENHGTNEAAALYNLAVAFPTLPHAHQWLLLAKQRFEWQIKGIIDNDGQLIENSPYYDFYTLGKYWEIYQYMTAQRQATPADFAAKLRSMLNFATYILQPNSQVPLLGASLEATINYHGIYESMAKADPSLLYVLTHGRLGSAPPADSKFFPASALTVMRSGWQAGADYPNSTYLTFNIGRYRTAHSDLDALGLTLYGEGGDLLTDPGLYTYAPGPYRNYFHGTMSHNDVTVDGTSQFQGDGEPGPLVTKDGLTYQSAESSLYEGVQHRRMVMLVDANHVLVVDQLHSRSVHTYRQMFHLFPSAQLHKSGLTVSGVGGSPRREITIQQLQPQGISESDVIGQRGAQPAGLCSAMYGRLTPCHQISYQTRGRDASFATLLTIGEPRPSDFGIRVSPHGSRFSVTSDGRHLKIALGHSAAVAPKAWATDPTPPPVKAKVVAAEANPRNWAAEDGATITPVRTHAHQHHAAVSKLRANGTSLGAAVNNAIRLNLKRHNGRLKLKVTGLARVSKLELSLSNDNWARSASTNLLNSLTNDAGGQWRSIFVGPSRQMGSEGGWKSAPGFSWSAVDGIKIKLEARTATARPPTVRIGRMTLLPVQRTGKVAFIFDDGYQSILPAAAYMHSHGMAGNVAVIGKYVDYPTQDYLNLFQLKSLQNNWGWNMANHTQAHVDAVQHYYDLHNLSGYANDILEQATWLEANHLNSAPNWIIYPHGATNSALEKVVSRFYMFSRGVTDNPDSYPFGDPHDVNNLEIQYPGDGEGTDIGYTSPREIMAAVKSAQRNHMTVLLTFHRIHSQPSDSPGYPLRLFREVVNRVQKSGIQVMTLSQLDRSNGVPVANQIHASTGKRSQITVSISD